MLGNTSQEEQDTTLPIALFLKQGFQSGRFPLTEAGHYPCSPGLEQWLREAVHKRA